MPIANVRETREMMSRAKASGSRESRAGTDPLLGAFLWSTIVCLRTRATHSPQDCEAVTAQVRRMSTDTGAAPDGFTERVRRSTFLSVMALASSFPCSYRCERTA